MRKESERETGMNIDYLSLDDDALVAQCAVDHYRSSGPGGQKRNKTSSAVRLRHAPTGLSVTASEDRSQHVNKKRAVRRLREAIALHVRRPLELSTYQMDPAIRPLLRSTGITVGPRHPDYYRVVREVLDVLSACGMRVGEAAAVLDLSTAQLVKLIQDDVKLWERVNQLRAEAGVRPLR